MKKTFLLLFSLGFIMLFILIANERIVKADDTSVGFGIYDNDEKKVVVILNVKNNDTVRLYEFQHLVSDDGRITDCEVLEKRIANPLAGFGGYRSSLFFLTGYKVGKYTVRLFDSEGNVIITFYVEVTGNIETIEADFEKMEGSRKRYLKLDKDGTVVDFDKLTVKNTSSSDLKIAYLNLDNCKNEPDYTTIKAGKTKTIKNVNDTFYSISEAKKNYSLTKKQVKKLKTGKAVAIELDYAYLAYQYQGYVFAREIGKGTGSEESSVSR